MSDLKVLEKEYPCLAAVNRCANGRTLFGPLIMTLFTRSALPDTINSPPCSCASSSGQSYQAAVLRRRTHPEDTHAGGKGEKDSRSSAEQGSVRVWISLLVSLRVPAGHYLRHRRRRHQGRRLHGRHAQGQVWRCSCCWLLPGNSQNKGKAGLHVTRPLLSRD